MWAMQLKLHELYNRFLENFLLTILGDLISVINLATTTLFFSPASPIFIYSVVSLFKLSSTTLKSISEIILKNKPKRTSQSSDTTADQKKSIKAKKVLKTSEVKKVSKSVKGDKVKTPKEKEK